VINPLTYCRVQADIPPSLRYTGIDEWEG